MAKKKKNSKVRDYRHDEKRKNNPPIGMVNYVLALFTLHHALCSIRYRRALFLKGKLRFVTFQKNQSPKVGCLDLYPIYRMSFEK